MSDAQAIDDALAAGPVTFYIGYDPTAPSLHVGNLVCIMAMRRLQQHGHKPIVVLGSGTARIGDPSGKSELRKMLDDATIERHVARIAGHFDSYLRMGPGEGEALDNWSWLSKLGWLEVLRDIGPHFTVNRMIAVKTYRDRLDAEQPLSFLEFNYQLLQAYDFARLHREHGCTLQLGGSDQWGNIIAGVELIRRLGAGSAQCLTFPLLTTADGKKMGKTVNGAVWLAADMCPAFDYYQYWISVDDRDVRRMLGTFTDLPIEEIDQLCTAEGAALREVKARLAFEATALRDGVEAAERARDAAKQAFGGGDDWSAVPEIRLALASIKLLDLLVDPQVAAFPSKRQARERVEGGGVKLDGVAVTAVDHELVAAALGDSGVRLQAGKKLRLRVVLTGTP
ncbi:MAG: tyrosine--tRNA ligase [Deltaproteobacteria bacterium]|nr:tyrosine--tRNA ligase [Nannocystaceae bacterium]